MAGQAVLSAFMQVLFEKLIAAAVDEFRLFRGVHGELQQLASTLSTIQALLEDAEEKQLKDKSVRYWLGKLKSVAYDMDELLDRHASEILRRKLGNKVPKGSWKRKVRSISSYSIFHEISSDHKLAHKIRSIQQKFDKIARERDSLGLQISSSTSEFQFLERPQTSSLVDDGNIFGRQEDKEIIVKMLLSDKVSGYNVHILPIVGMGGLGKTTLAQLAYNDPRVKEHFSLRMWVCVSDNFNEIKLTKETLESANSGVILGSVNSGKYATGTLDFMSTTTNMNLLQEDLYGKLKGQRFLLVLDDVWNENPSKWHRYRKPFLSAGRGSMIIVTSQSENVARTMGGLPPYKLKHLSDDDCWSLFKNYAFADGISGIHPNLEEIGKEIVKKLKGLPLAAKTLGSLLYSKFEEADWKSILKSEIWELPPDKNNILPALRLSYKHLPPHLKQCFAFCSVFHKDFMFHKDKLVKIWMALGFVQPQRSKCLEDIGNSYFDELVSRSFFHPYKGNYVMHDAIHDLAQSLSIEECHRLEDPLRDIDPKEIRHLSFSCKNSSLTSFEQFCVFEKLRTVLLLRGYKSRTSHIPEKLFVKLRCLRVLELSRRDIYELPNSIGNLIQLRYLGLAGTYVQTLPESIGKLYNLQTLNLKHCNELAKLPDTITNLINLRHLETTTRVISEISGIGKLTCLQELEKFSVRKDSGHKIIELKCMNNLRGFLHIRDLQNVNKAKEAIESNMSNKEYLNVLSLEWADVKKNGALENHQDDEVLEALRPHQELRELSIKGYTGTKFASWFNSPLFSNLETINISNCRRCKIVPPLGKLPLLKNLDIGGFQSLVRISKEFSGNSGDYQSLIVLILADMPQLEEWVCMDQILSFPCITELEIVDCPNLTKLPHLPPTLKRLRISELGLIVLPDLHYSNSLCLPSVSALQIHQCPHLRSLYEGMLGQQLITLEQLTITDCEELIFLPSEGFRNLVSLKSLHIFNCPELMPLENDGILLPNSLKDLQITSCFKLINKLLMQLSQLSALENLKINNCPELEYFPVERLPVTLKSVGIFSCNHLRGLHDRLHEVSSLTTLILNNCHQLQFLPDKGLPAELQELCIIECPLLKAQYQNDDEHISHKIIHIPEVIISGMIPMQKKIREKIHNFIINQEHQQYRGREESLTAATEC